MNEDVLEPISTAIGGVCSRSLARPIIAAYGAFCWYNPFKCGLPRVSSPSGGTSGIADMLSSLASGLCRIAKPLAESPSPALSCRPPNAGDCREPVISFMANWNSLRLPFLSSGRQRSRLCWEGGGLGDDLTGLCSVGEMEYRSLICRRLDESCSPWYLAQSARLA